MAELDFLPYPPKTEVDRWNREWMSYFATEDMSPHLVQSDYLSPIKSIAGLSEEEVFNLSLTKQDDGIVLTPLHVWVRGDTLLGKNVLEIGCGCGWLGKQLGLISNSYLGIDVSPLALAIARGNSPRNCTYLHLSEQDHMKPFAGQMDIMVGREFFIHQNFETALWVLMLGAYMLRPEGLIAADFYFPNREYPQGIVHPAKSALDPTYASCAFSYTMKEIDELADQTGLRVVSCGEHISYQRRFVTFQKHVRANR